MVPHGAWAQEATPAPAPTTTAEPEAAAAPASPSEPAPVEVAPEAAPAEPVVVPEPVPPAAVEPAAPAPAPESKLPFEITGAPGKGLTFKTGDNFSLNIRSRIQLRYQMHIPPKDDAGNRQLDQTVNIGTLRLWLSGNILVPELKYMIQLAFAGRDYRDGATSPVYDAFLDYNAHRDINVKAGQYFVPFDRLRTVREFALQMADRPRPVAEFTLDRDVGVTLYSEKFLGDKSPLAWRIGAFGGGGTNLSLGKEPGGLFVG
ncbi:MAG TPA: hypothetical protein VN764_07920, partial [Polyangiaceae bacterium]|nr:hypothetical protein [Polyangiaceae bacterium]